MMLRLRAFSCRDARFLRSYQSVYACCTPSIQYCAGGVCHDNSEAFAVVTACVNGWGRSMAQPWA